jgi:hypothetical protein
MRKTLLAAGAAFAMGAGSAHATTVADPTGDFLASFLAAFPSGAAPDLDITSFTVDLDTAASAFDISGTLAGPIDHTHSNLYVIGVQTGPGAIHPFDNIGEPNVLFNQAILVRETGTASLGANALAPTFNGDTFSVSVPFALLPSTGFATDHFRFNFWARNGLGNNNQNADFAPQNATILAVPEPASWALMIAGFGLAGAAVRGRRTARAA